MCRVLEVRRQSYYSWLKRPESKRTGENRGIVERIRQIHAERKMKAYGSPRVHKELEKAGIRVGRNRIAKLMKLHGIKAICARKYKPQSQAVPDEKAAPNLVAQKFTVKRPNEVWVTDMTYILTGQGWIYLCAFLDLYSRKIVGWASGRNMRSSLIVRALDKAVRNRRPSAGLIIHSDRGVQYGSEEFRVKLRDYGFRQSMSRIGNCWDNACMESFFHSLKYEYLIQFKPESLEDVNWLCFKYIDAFYNTSRLHSYLGYVSPALYERHNIA
jgi:transposase InsO family protein